MTTVLKESIDIDSIIHIMESTGDGMGGFYGYLDLETGKVIMGGYDSPIKDIPFDENGEIPEELEHRYLEIPNLGSRDGYQDMVDFIDTLSDEKLRDLLSVAIKGKGAFGRFKDVMRRSEYKSQQEAWFAFCDRAEKERVFEWLAEKGVSVSS